MWESIILLSPPPTCIARTIAILLHVYCARNDAPLAPPLYAIHYTIWVMAISCKDQSGMRRRLGLHKQGGCVLAFTRHCVTSRPLCTNQFIISVPPPTCIAHPVAILLRNIRPPFDLPFVCHTLCNTVHSRVNPTPILSSDAPQPLHDIAIGLTLCVSTYLQREPFLFPSTVSCFLCVVCVCMYVCVYIYTYIHTYIHTYTHTHTHTYI